jgi:hypothetical protein
MLAPVVAVPRLEVFGVTVKVTTIRVVAVVIVFVFVIVFVVIVIVRFGSRSHGRDNVRGADIDDMGVTSDTIVPVIEVNLAFGEQRLQLSHCYCVVLGVV